MTQMETNPKRLGSARKSKLRFLNPRLRVERKGSEVVDPRAEDVGQKCVAEDNCASICSNLVGILNNLCAIRIRQSTVGRCFRCNRCGEPSESTERNRCN